MFFLAAADPSKPLSMAGISAALRLSAKQEAIRVCKDSVGDCQVSIFCSRRCVSDALASRRDAATAGAVASLESVRTLQ